MTRWACSARECPYGPDDIEPEEQYDPYGIYGGRWHDDCWEKWGYGNFKFDASYAGESLEEDW